VISSKRATLHECCTVYGVEAVYLLLEHASVDAHNHRLIREWAKKQD
jgi:hypothetical protein